MAENDQCCTLVPYFKIAGDKLDEFKDLSLQCVEQTRSEPKCLFYGFSFLEDQAHCREGYEDADGILAHLENVGPLLEKLLAIAELTRLEVHGPAGEIEKLRTPLADLNPQYFTLTCGFRN